VQLLLIRHGHPDYRTDSLTERGHVEAARLAEALDAFPIDAAFASSMGRARQTAEYTLARRGMDVTVCHWLRELDGRYGYTAAAPEWHPDDPSPSAYEVHPAGLMARSELYSYERWDDQVDYGPWLRPQCDALCSAFDDALSREGYVRQGLRYAVQGSNRRTLAFFCHGGVIATLLSHLLYISLPVALPLFVHETAGYSLLRSVEDDGHAAFRMVFLNSISHKDVAQIASHP
jgi:broad specificity phosphatase PhoE